MRSGQARFDDRPACTLDLTGIEWHPGAENSCIGNLAAATQPIPCEIIRATARRRVLKSASPAPVLIKQYFLGGPLQRIKNFLRGVPAKREWRALHAARERGLPVPKPLALGFLPDSAVLFTEFIARAYPLDQVLRAPLGSRRRAQIIHETALLMRAMHDAGLYHRDLHLGNVIVRERDDNLQLWLLDFQRTEIDPWRPRTRRWRDLATLHGGASGRLADNLRFLKAYRSARPALSEDGRSLAIRLDEAGRRHRFRVWRSRRKRCCAENWEFRAVRAGSLAGFARRSCWNVALESALAAPGEAPADGRVVKDSHTTKVVSTIVGGHKFFIKRYNFQSIGYALKNLFRPCRAKRGWRAANDCHLRGIDGALPVAYLEHRRWRLLRESVIVTAAVEGQELSHLLASGAVNLAARRALLRALARWVRSLNDRGLVPRDLKGENIIAVPRESSGYRFFLVDFDGISRCLPKRQPPAKILSRLARAISAEAPLSATNRLRLVHGYLGRARAREGRKLYRWVTAQAARSRSFSAAFRL